jgi:hypothetical protein
MIKGLILALGALAYVHYVHQASLSVNHKLDNLRSVYVSSDQLSADPDADLTSLVK